MPGILKGRSPNNCACGSTGPMAVTRTMLGVAAATTLSFSRLICSSNGISSEATRGLVRGVNVACWSPVCWASSWPDEESSDLSVTVPEGVRLHPESARMEITAKLKKKRSRFMQKRNATYYSISQEILLTTIRHPELV